MHVITVGYHYPLPLLHIAPCFSCHISLPLSSYRALVSIVFGTIIPTSFNIVFYTCSTGTCRDGADTTISPTQTNGWKLLNTTVLSLFRHISISMSGSTPEKLSNYIKYPAIVTYRKLQKPSSSLSNDQPQN